jgi:hypothetical protein
VELPSRQRLEAGGIAVGGHDHIRPRRSLLSPSVRRLSGAELGS